MCIYIKTFNIQAQTGNTTGKMHKQLFIYHITWMIISNFLTNSTISKYSKAFLEPSNTSVGPTLSKNWNKSLWFVENKNTWCSHFVWFKTFKVIFIVITISQKHIQMHLKMFSLIFNQLWWSQQLNILIIHHLTLHSHLASMSAILCRNSPFGKHA